MNFQMLEYFTVVAECLNISDAARRLYVSQPAISRQIMALESELGVQLFHRTKPYLTLTEAGHSLRADAEKIVSMSYEFIDRAKKNTETVSGSITVGYSGHLEYPLLFKLFAHMSKHYPLCSFRFVKATLDTLSKDLQNGSLDIIFCPLTNLTTKMPEDIQCHIIEHAPSVLAVSENHRLANKSIVSIADLASEEIVAFSRRESSVHNDFIIEICKEAGFSARISYEVSDINTFLLTIASNQAVGFVGSTVEKIFTCGIKLIPIKEFNDPANVPHYVRVGAAWRKSNSNRALDSLIESLSTIYPDIGL